MAVETPKTHFSPETGATQRTVEKRPVIVWSSALERPAAPILLKRSRLATLLNGVSQLVEYITGVVALLGSLALLTTISLFNLLILGYLLEASGQIARTGQLHDGVVGVRKAVLVGTLILGTWIVLLPVRLVSEMWASAELIDADSKTTVMLGLLFVALTILAVIHLLWSWWRGGCLQHFFWPAPITLLKRLF